MVTARGSSLVVQPDQWARCAHDGTALLPGGGVELTWIDPGSRASAPDHRAPLPAPSGLAFDRWCRAYRSHPAGGRVDVISEGTTPQHETDPRPGLLRQPTGLAVDRRQRLYVAESGAGQVHVVDLWAQRLLRRVPIRGGRPLDVAARCGSAVALTSEPALVLLDGRRGARPGPPLVAPAYPRTVVAQRVAPGPLVLWRARDGRSVVARTDGTVLLEAQDVTDLDAGPDPGSNGSGSLLVLAGRPGDPLRRFTFAASATSGPVGEVTEIEPAEAIGYDGGAVCIAPNGRIAFTTARGLGWTSGSAARFHPEGRVVSYRLDSGAYLTRWGRLMLDACVPAGTSLSVRFVTTDDDTVPDPMPPSPPARGAREVPDPDATPPLAPMHLLAAAPPGSALFRRPAQPGQSALAGRNGPDASSPQTYEAQVLAAPGRYLWVELSLHGTGRSSPRVTAMRVERPGHALLSALPRGWSRQEDDASFLHRFLAPAEGLLNDLDERAADRAVLVNPQAAPSETLSWLAGFAGLVLDERWSEASRRTLIAQAYALFRRRGTIGSLIRIVQIYLDQAPTLIEQWQLRGLAGAVLGTTPGGPPPPVVGGGASRTGTLGRFQVGGSVPGRTAYNASAHRFTLLIPGNLSYEQRDVVQQILDLHRPAHTQVQICELGPGMRVGGPLRLDLTSYVGPGTDGGPAIVGQVLIGADGVVGLPAIGSRLAEDSSVGRVRVG